jgi:hypothetical protein
MNGMSKSPERELLKEAIAGYTRALASLDRLGARHDVIMAGTRYGGHSPVLRAAPRRDI